MAFSPEELDFLFANPAAVAEAESLPLTKKSLLGDVATLRKSHGEYARALAELATARRALQRKLGPGEWFADTDSAQQATPAAVAQFRADYLAQLGVTSVADVTCSVGTELLWAPPVASGSDIDHARLRMARANLQRCGRAPLLARADALHPVWSAEAIIADPARRNSSGRITKMQYLMPPLPELAARYERLAVKCAPGLNINDVAEWAGQVDFVSVDGEMKEACVYSRGLIAGPLRTRAVVLGERPQVWTADLPDDCDVAGVGQFIIDPDAALIRAGLVRHYAHAHGLWQLDEHLAYLSGDAVPEGVRGFEVLEQVPLRQVKAALAARHVGAAEILVRGVDVDPDVLRKKWKLKGPHSVSVIIARVDSADNRQAFICRPVIGGSDK